MSQFRHTCSKRISTSAFIATLFALPRSRRLTRSNLDAGKSDIQNRIQAGMGGERDDETISAGSTTAPDTGNAAQAKHLTDGN